MAEERQEGQELLLPPFFVGRMLSILPTPNFALQSWGFVAQDGARRPGIEMHILMEPPSGDSIKIKIIFWGTGAPQKITFFSDTSSTEVSVIYLREDPGVFFDTLWELFGALRYSRPTPPRGGLPGLSWPQLRVGRQTPLRARRGISLY